MRGTYTNCESRTVKVLTERGRRSSGTISLRYSQRYGTAEILSVTVAGEDGSVRDVDFASTLKDATSNASVSSNIYDPMDRVLTCQVPGLRVGDTLTYKTRRVALRPRVENVFSGVAAFEWTTPVLRSVYSVKAPAARPLKSVAIRHPIGNVSYERRELDDGSVLHEWTATNSPQAFPEPHMPSLITEVETLHVSTAGDWREISDWYWRLALPHMERTTPAMTNLVESLGCDIDRIRVWVAENVRYMGLTMEDKSPGYAPHDIDITFENRYGVCRDKAALLAALLRLAGHEAYPVLIRVGAKMDPDVPSPYFNHAIVAVADESAPDGYRLMDPTPETSRDEFPAYLCNRSYLVARPGGETLLMSRARGADENCLKVRTKGRVAKDLSAVLETKVSFGGSNDSSLRRCLMRMTADETRKHFESVASAAAPGAERNISIRVHADGSADCEVELLDFGCDAGVTRKFYAEMLPEKRSRRLLSLVKAYSQSAEPTGEFVTDVESYPARVRYGFHVPDYAVTSGDMMKMHVFGLRTEGDSLGSSRRTTPFVVRRADPSMTVVTVSLPKEYPVVEFLPAPFRFEEKEGGMHDALEVETSRAADGAVELRFVRDRASARDAVKGPERVAEERARCQAGSRKGAFTVCVRKPGNAHGDLV